MPAVTVIGVCVASLGMLTVAERPAPQPSASTPAGSIHRPFVPNGTIVMDLSAGDYVIGPSEDDSIRLTWTTRDPDDAKRVEAKAEVSGSTATIVTDGPHDGFRVEIQVPPKSNVKVSLSAGEIEMRGIEGNKDVSAWAGEVRIGVGRAADYRRVYTSVTAGEIRARPFDVSKEGLFRSFNWEGNGRYDLRVRLTAGEVTLDDRDAR